MVRYGILGFGLHAEKRLMPGFARATQSQAVAFWRHSQERAAETAASYGLENHSSIESLCSSPKVDAIFLASPDALHLAHARIALQHGKPVLCEKPMAMNAAECAEMIAVAEAAGAKLTVAQVMRFHESVNAAREWIAAGRLGSPLHARCDFLYPGMQSPRRWITDAALAAGGPTADVGAHCFDALRYVLQQEVKSVFATMILDAASGSVEANSTSMLELSGGTTGNVFVSTRAPYRTYLEVVGTERSLECRNALWVDGPVELVLLESGRVVEQRRCDNSLSYARQVDAFSAWITSGTPFPCTAQDGLLNQLVIDAAYKSARTGLKVEIAAEAPSLISPTGSKP